MNSLQNVLPDVLQFEPSSQTGKPQILIITFPVHDFGRLRRRRRQRELWKKKVCFGTFIRLSIRTFSLNYSAKWRSRVGSPNKKTSNEGKEGGFC